MTSPTSSSNVGDSWTVMEHVPTMSTGVPLAPVMLIPEAGMTVRPCVSAHLWVNKVMEAPVSTIIAPLVAGAPGYIWATATPR